MTIDWLTVAAQIVNFLILVWLLKRFLYQRVVDAMERRQQKIVERMEEARRQAREAEQQAEAYERRSRELEARKEEMLADAGAAADRLREQRRDELRGEIEATRKRWLEQVERERETFIDALREQTAKRCLAVARRALADLANASLEEQVVAAFLERVRGSDRSAVEDVVARCRQAREPVVVASGFALPPGLEASITRTIQEQFGDQLELVFEVAADLVCGIELTGGGQSVRWSLDGYLDTLETSLSRLLEENDLRAQVAPSDA